MSSLSKQEQLRLLIDEQQERIRQTVLANRGRVVVARTRAKDWRYLESQETLHNSTLCSSGWYKALQLCFGDAARSPYASLPGTDSTLDAWADRVLLECDRLA